MLTRCLSAAFAVVLVMGPAMGPAMAEDDKAKEWCTDAHMATMTEQIGKMTDADAKKAATEALDKSKAAMQAGDMAGCVTNMEASHKAMGM